MNNAPKLPGFPIHRLNSGSMRYWNLSNHERKRMMTNALQKRYPRRGVGLLNQYLELFAIVDPTGNYRLLSPPFTRFEMWQVNNAPEHFSKCACRNYIDIEAGGEPWSNRDGRNGHHPHCQFNQFAVHTFTKSEKYAHENIAQGKKAQSRPDAWMKDQEEIKHS